MIPKSPLNIVQLRKRNNIDIRIMVAELADPVDYPPGTGHNIRNEPIWMRKHPKLPGHESPVTCKDYTSDPTAARSLFMEHLTDDEKLIFWKHIHGLVEHVCPDAGRNVLGWYCMIAVGEVGPRDICHAFILTKQAV